MLPRIILYNAVGLDGRIDGFMPDVGLFYSLIAIWKEDATLAGCDTILAAPEVEEPASVAPKDANLPLLVIPDSRGRIQNWRSLRNAPYWRDIVVLCSNTTPTSYIQALKDNQIAYIQTGEDHVDYRSAFEALSQRYGVQTMRVDSGGLLNGVLLQAGLVDEISLLLHPAIAGTDTARSFLRGIEPSGLKNTPQLNLIHCERLQKDIVWLRYQVLYAEQ